MLQSVCAMLICPYPTDAGSGKETPLQAIRHQRTETFAVSRNDDVIPVCVLSIVADKRTASQAKAAGEECTVLWR